MRTRKRANAFSEPDERDDADSATPGPTTAKHTPGPWEAVTSNSAWQVSDALGNRIATLNTALVYQEEFAKLLAAAPETAAERDQLKAVNSELVEALENIEANLTGRDCFQERVADSLQRARAALAKARGET